MPPGQFDIHRITVADTMATMHGGVTIGAKLVSYFIGDSGPFVLRYHPDEYTAERVTADMAAEVAKLRAIHGAHARP